MLTHLNYEDWLDWVPAIAFAIVFGVFSFSLLRLWRMDSRQTNHAANLPLEDDAPNSVEKKTQ